MFQTRTPKVSENDKIIIHLDNPLQEEIFSKVFNQLLNSIRKQLKNSNIRLEAKSAKEEDSGDKNGKLYTLDDKFNYLADKNPSLKKLKRDLDLDFDFN
ncbi:MAG: hypothetical protein R6U04_14075 [Bacteroidales bacterium]